jgi:hypothetical protein
MRRSELNEATFTYSDGKNTVYFDDARTMTRTALRSGGEWA